MRYSVSSLSITACGFLLAGMCLILALAGDVRAQQPTDTAAGAPRLDSLARDVALLKRIKISGYLQVHCESHEDSRDATADASGKIAKSNADAIIVKEGRAKIQYQAAKTSRFTFYIDGSRDKFRLIEAYIDLTHEFGGRKVELSVGQENIPFGYEIEYPTAKRNFPERSTMERKLFAGERDRMINLTVWPDRHLSLNAAILNGPGIVDNDFTWESPFKGAKNFVGRVKANAATGYLRVSGGVSAYVGTQFDKNDARDFQSSKDRWGVDAQCFYPLFPRLGETVLRIEAVVARERGRAARGGYAWLAQDLAKRFGAAVRFDSYDPDVDLKDGSKLDQVSLAGHYFYDEHVRITLDYDWRHNEAVTGKEDPKDNILTLQFQYAF